MEIVTFHNNTQPTRHKSKMHLNTYIDLNKKVITFTQLVFNPADGESYVCQVTKRIMYKITLPELGIKCKYAWNAHSCAVALRDCGRGVDIKHIVTLFKKRASYRSLGKFKMRLSGAVVERSPLRSL